MESKEGRAARLKAEIRRHAELTFRYLRGFVTWVVIGLALGAFGGLVGAAFSLSVGCVTAFRQAHRWIVWLLPAGGALIAALYSVRGARPTDTNGILLAIHSPADISPMTGPDIFLGTVVTHLFGGSAGREGAALQLGGVLGYVLAKRSAATEKETHVIVMCGMSAVFSALFGTPLTAAVFAMEVASVGILHFSAVVPCLTSALTAVYLAQALGAGAEAFQLAAAPAFTAASAAAVAGIAAAGALVSILYCVALRQGGRGLAALLPNPFLRIMAGGAAVALLTWAVGGTDYNGAGMDVIAAALNGHARPEAFALKLVFTVLTMASGYRGGEIVPAMFIGATLGCVLAGPLGLDPGLGAAVGLLALFCGSLNCPISALLLGAELFGAANLRFFAVACAVSYMLSGNFGLYREQKIIYSKIRPEFINRYTK